MHARLPVGARSGWQSVAGSTAATPHLVPKAKEVDCGALIWPHAQLAALGRLGPRQLGHICRHGPHGAVAGQQAHQRDARAVESPPCCEACGLSGSLSAAPHRLSLLLLSFRQCCASIRGRLGRSSVALGSAGSAHTSLTRKELVDGKVYHRCLTTPPLLPRKTCPY
jgi:hypothetical protein